MEYNNHVLLFSLWVQTGIAQLPSFSYWATQIGNGNGNLHRIPSLQQASRNTVEFGWEEARARCRGKWRSVRPGSFCFGVWVEASWRMQSEMPTFRTCSVTPSSHMGTLASSSGSTRGIMVRSVMHKIRHPKMQSLRSRCPGWIIDIDVGCF